MSGITVLVVGGYYGGFKWASQYRKPCMNLAYYYYSDNEWIDWALHTFFWPMHKIEGRTVHYGPMYMHFRDRRYPTAEEMSVE